MLKKAKKRRMSTAVLRRQSVAHISFSKLSDLKLMRALGKGTFGSVYLAKEKVGGRMIALKCLDKRALMESSQYEYIKREVIALQSFKHAFIGAYYGALLTPRKVIFMIEYIPGML